MDELIKTFEGRQEEEEPADVVRKSKPFCILGAILDLFSCRQGS